MNVEVFPAPIAAQPQWRTLLAADRAPWSLQDPQQRFRWRNAPGDLRDWIGLYKAGETDVTQYLGFTYTDALFVGEKVVAPDEADRPWPPGDYELRLMHDETYVVLASARIKIAP